MRVPTMLRWPVLLAFLISGAFAHAHAGTVDDVDLSGYWEPLDMEDYQSAYMGPDPVDFTGLPLNDQGRARALSYSFDQASMVDHACLYYPVDYLVIGPFGFRFSPVIDPDSGGINAWRISPWVDRQQTVIWMDGRNHPGPNAMHSFAGFTTGVWEDHTLTTYTTHLLEGPLRRNGAMSSNEASITMHFTRHDNYLQVTVRITDPAYLSEPYVLSKLFRLNPRAYLKDDMVFPCVPRVFGVPRGSVPNFLPGKNPLEKDFATQYGLPLDAALGGAQTMYPEYRQHLEKTYRRPTATCKGYCCGWGDPRNPEHFNRFQPLMCPGLRHANQEVLELIDHP